MSVSSMGKSVRLFLKDGTLHYEYIRRANRPDAEIVLCGVGDGMKAFLRKKGNDYYETSFTEAPLPA